jgi:uncharacterized membrane protein
MRSVELSVTIRAPRDVVLHEISEYTHPPILHDWVIKSVKVLEDENNVSTALWRLKVLGFVREAKQRQIITAPEKMTNETIEGFARGTLESTFLNETDEGTEIVDRIDVRIPKWGWLLEIPVAWYTKRITHRILMDHKRDLEARFGKAPESGE